MARQGWRDVTFLHWRVRPDRLVRCLPRGLEPNVFDGSAWIGITPFRVVDFALLALPRLPRGSCFAETNVRAYVIGPDGRDGLWFFDLEVDESANLVARVLLG